eukprot:364496-Chlamydomonas_euryale.AAC.16
MDMLIFQETSEFPSHLHGTGNSHLFNGSPWEPDDPTIRAQNGGHLCGVGGQHCEERTKWAVTQLGLKVAA